MDKNVVIGIRSVKSGHILLYSGIHEYAMFHSSYSANTMHYVAVKNKMFTNRIA